MLCSVVRLFCLNRCQLCCSEYEINIQYLLLSPNLKLAHDLTLFSSSRSFAAEHHTWDATVQLDGCHEHPNGLHSASSIHL